MNLNIMHKLFKLFEKEKIAYLHFKSNTNLSLSFQNKADFDVLVDKRRITDIERIIISCNGKRHNPAHIGNYPGVDNWLVFDENDGNIFHLHLHYQLVTGKALLKDYVLPWSEILFQTRIKDPEHGIYVADPSLELILLATRSVLKAKPFDYLKKRLGMYSLSRSMKREWDDLFGKMSQEKLAKYLRVLYPNSERKFFQILAKEHLTTRDFRILHNIVRKDMNVHRRLSPIESSFKAFGYRMEDLTHKFWSRKMGGMSITKKTSLQGGLIIAFIGVDGAGKSTVSNEIKKWIGRKIECKRFYMGIGDGKTTVFVSLLKKIKGLLAHHNTDGTNYSQPTKRVTVKEAKKVTFLKNPSEYVKKYLKLCMIGSVEKNNNKKIRKMHQYRLNGGICILDRFPQIEIAGQNDGPKVPSYVSVFGEKSFIKRRMKTEMSRLNIVKEIKPDMIFRLNISADTCVSRKSENENKDAFEKKIQDLNKLKFQGATIVDIDAELPYEEEILNIKKYLWKYI